MTFHSLQSGQQATGWIYKDFKQARRKLIFLYLLVMAGIITLFSFFLITQLKERVEIPTLPQNKQIVITEKEARLQAQAIFPDNTIQETEYELDDGTLLFTVSFDDDKEVKTDMFTGKSVIAVDKQISWIDTITDDIDEIIWWIALVMFFISALVSSVIAHKTLQPIALSIEKQKRFVGDAAHELRNPLAAIHTTIESALLDPGADKEMLGDLLSETKRLIGTSENLLNLEKKERGHAVIENINVTTAVNSVLDRLKKSTTDKEILIETEITTDPIRIDAQDLHTILYNLISNAIKFSDKGSRILITWRKNELVVKDNGIGIDQKHLPHIFDRFYKADQARGFTYTGSGLGLSLVREIVEQYKGKIMVQSEKNKGATFTILFS